MAIIAVFLSLLSACTRASIPIDAARTRTPKPVEDIQTVEPPESRDLFARAGTYAVAWVSEDETLTLRVPAGISGSVVDELEYDAHGVRVTGNTTSLGSSLWVEIQGQDEKGWVNSWNLIEDVPDEDFCSDPRVLDLLEQGSQALLEEDVDRFGQIVNPKRGLILRFDWWNPEVVIRSSDLSNIYLSRTDREWGVLSGGDFEIRGSFNDVFYPVLKDVLSQMPTAVCGEIPSGVTSLPVVWPGEYTNIQYYAFYRPSPEGGNRYDWRTLVFGFEYIDGEPYLTLLVHYHGDI